MRLISRQAKRSEESASSEKKATTRMESASSEKKATTRMVLKKDAYDNDIRNAELVIDKHSIDPFEVMRIQQYDDVPMALHGDDIVIRVEASTVSDTDSRIRDGSFNWKYMKKPQFPLVPGIDCVGIIESVGSLAIKSGLDVGDRVAALSLNGCTSKYITLKIDEVIKVPDDVDSAEAATVIRTYTAAFQCLMQECHGRDRYKRKPLADDRVLIVGPCGVFERALVELATYLGAKRVYFSCVATNQKSHDMYIRMLGAKPLSKDHEDWSDELQGKIDICVDSSCVDRFEHSYKSLKEDGLLVVNGMRELEKDGGIFTGIEKAWTSAWVACNPQCIVYDGILNSYFTERKVFVKDLIYLFAILEKGRIKPKVASRIPMSKVAAAQERLDINKESLERRGVIVVQPWTLSPDIVDPKASGGNSEEENDEDEEENTVTTESSDTGTSEDLGEEVSASFDIDETKSSKDQ